MSAVRRGVVSLLLAVTMFTVTPVPVTATVRADRRTARLAIVWLPTIGIALGAVAAAVLYAVHFLALGPIGDYLAATLAISLLAAATRCLHLDGLADTADGLGSRAAPARALEIMRRSDIGPFGVVTLLLLVIVQISALAQCMHLGWQFGMLAVIAAVVAGRIAVVVACSRHVPSARPDGFGALVAGSLSRLVGWSWSLVVLGLAWTGGNLLDKGIVTVAAVLAGLVAAAILRGLAVRRFGGVTGDVFGALVETTTTVVLVVLALGG
ncbi:adenosylcobinamide-GDP ribazoletransferase [Fodinicola acaciae]|uniref:adenosylcobinamide-GDP ribazoletransferase n=1 Tax=Fodinicola acaciae TaxID=2681555 RepID=UPI00165226BA|nr:adenosylcobinamide-GDP ribazoletransferase [Fodinicola acaciae]